MISVGTFDGVHRGHMQIINKVKDLAKEKQVDSLVITFDPHPRLVLQKDTELLRFITSLNERKRGGLTTHAPLLLSFNFVRELSMDKV